MLNSIWYKCLQWWSTYSYSSGQVYHHPSCSDYRTSNFCVRCEEQWQYNAGESRWKMFFLEAVPATISSHTCIVEYSDHLATFFHDCYSPVWAVIDPPTSYYCLCNMFITTSSWFHTHCCLHSVSVSKAWKEKFSVQCKVLWKYVFVLCCDYCNHWTYSHTACPVWADAASVTTNRNWSKGNNFVIAPIFSTVCTGMVLEKKVSEEITECCGRGAVNSWGIFNSTDWQ